MDHHVRVRWTSHQGTVLSMLDLLQSTDSMVDCTLACDGHFIRVHRVVLSACSPYFQVLIFKRFNMLVESLIFGCRNCSKFKEMKNRLCFWRMSGMVIWKQSLNTCTGASQAFLRTIFHHFLPLPKHYEFGVLEMWQVVVTKPKISLFLVPTLLLMKCPH